MPRIACLLVADLPWVAVVRAHPELAGQPLAVAAGSDPRAEVVALSPTARAEGVRLPCTVAQARVACADLKVRPAGAPLERAAHRALLDAALSTSPRAEPAPPGSGLYAAEAAVYLDTSGTASLFGSEAGLAGALAARARKLGLPAVVAVAGSRGVARIAARRLVLGFSPEHGEDGPVQVVPPGGEAVFLGPLPLDLLDPPDALAETFTRYGIQRVSDLLQLPRRALLTRLGGDAEPILRLLSGEERGPPPAAPRALGFEETADLECPLDRLEPLLFVLSGLLSRLGDRLTCRGLACAELLLQLRLVGGGHDARRVGVASPTTDPRVLLRLVALSLETRPPSAEIETISISTEGREPRGDQLDFFRPAGPAPAILNRTLAELEALCGPGRVGRPEVVDTHRPDAFAVAPFAPPPSGPTRRETAARNERVRETPPPYSAELTVRALRPPVAAQVRAAGGVPVFLQSAVARGQIVRAAGPWRSSGNWWSEEERFAFDHYDVATSDGVVVRLRWDALQGRWEIDALYD
jgi:protein ImuB